MEDKIVLYSSAAGNVNISVTYLNDTFWLTQKAITELFNCSNDNISLHLKNIFNSQELNPISVTEEISATASDGKNANNFFILPHILVEQKVHEKAMLEINKGNTYRVNIKMRDGKIYLGTKEHEMSYYFNNWDVIK
jgi:hypothetical protein